MLRLIHQTGLMIGNDAHKWRPFCSPRDKDGTKLNQHPEDADWSEANDEVEWRVSQRPVVIRARSSVGKQDDRLRVRNTNPDDITTLGLGIASLLMFWDVNAMRYGKDAVLKTVILSHDGLTVTTVTSQWKKDGRERRFPLGLSTMETIDSTTYYF
ncbi:hypothetical protein AFLA_010261 [Aspergillus flavus NRRL3357]|nr:hypothetical protein AFLA_010261 [Aspergillus flavus NRRL3357]